MFRETSGPWAASRMLLRGDFQSPGPAVIPGFLCVANPTPVSVTKVSPETNRRRRSALAHWLTRPDHPLTLRVLVNRIWQQHFVEGLVRTPSGFGYLGEEPSHSELLDWLATELVARKWDLKEMHRLIVLSSVYRQSVRQR